MTRSGEPHFFFSRFNQHALVRSAPQGSCTPEGCCVSAYLDAGAGKLESVAGDIDKPTKAASSSITGPVRPLTPSLLETNGPTS